MLVLVSLRTTSPENVSVFVQTTQFHRVMLILQHLHVLCTAPMGLSHRTQLLYAGVIVLASQGSLITLQDTVWLVASTSPRNSQTQPTRPVCPNAAPGSSATTTPTTVWA